VDAEVLKNKGEHRILDFELTDQTGATITKADTKGKIIVVDFFFTTCKTICPIMTNQMARVQEEFIDDDRLALLSHSVTPEIDTVGRLQEYAEIHDVDAKRWHLLTGPRPHINNLARRSYFACLTDGDGDEYDLVHTENFVLVDTLGRIRGFYDGTNEEEVDKLIKDIKQLF
jgi:protein SCO1/2